MMHHRRNVLATRRLSRDVRGQGPTGSLMLGLLVMMLLIGCGDHAQNVGGTPVEDIVDGVTEDAAPTGDDVASFVDIGESAPTDATEPAGETTGDIAAQDTEDALTDDAFNTLVDVVARAEDTGSEAQLCECQEDEVWLVGDCVPTSLLGCGESCSVDDPASCSEGWQCDPAAATLLCTSSSSAPACTPGPAMGFAGGDLRIEPTTTTVGKEVTVSVRGGLFYIGALFWMMRVGDEVLEPLIDWQASCTISMPWTPSQAGTFPVHVAYGSGGTSGVGWTLAGFISVDTPSQDTQPGFSCTSETTCAQAPPYTCTCQDGHCACTTDE